MLLVLVAIFLLIGIQGTSLIRFAAGSNTFEMERRRRRVVEAAKEIAKEEPERTAGILQGAALALPTLRPSRLPPSGRCCPDSTSWSYRLQFPAWSMSFAVPRTLDSATLVPIPICL